MLRDKVEILSAISNRNYDELKRYIGAVIDKIFEKLHANNLTDISKMLDEENQKFSRLIKKYTTEKNIDYLFGKYIGYLSAIENYYWSKKDRAKRDKLLDSEKTEDIPHINDIVINIHNNTGIRHGKLAEAVGIEKNTLTGIMNRLVKSGIVTYTRPGKYKYYFLTQSGTEYYNEKLKNTDNSRNIDSLIEQLIICISKNDNPDEAVGRVMQAIYKGKYMAEGYQCSLNEKLDPVILLPSIASMQKFDVQIRQLTNRINVEQTVVINLSGNLENPLLVFEPSCKNLTNDVSNVLYDIEEV